MSMDIGRCISDFTTAIYGIGFCITRVPLNLVSFEIRSRSCDGDIGSVDTVLINSDPTLNSNFS